MRCRLAFLGIGLVLYAASCRTDREHSGNRTVSDGARPAARDELARLVDSLGRIEGQFSLSGGQWLFSGDLRVFQRLRQYGDSAVERLAGCMDDNHPAVATATGQRVLVGAMCAAALQRIAYATEHEDSDVRWSGVVEPNASSQELSAAKIAWTDAIRRKAYRLS
jgi:hypothetical protein